MARGIGKLSFTKDWSKMNPPDFSTYEDSEEQVRADIQLLYNEIKDYLNNTIQPNVNEISAADITVSGGGNLQTKLAALDAEIDNVVLGQIPDGSLTSAKLAPGTLLSNVTSSLTITAVDMAAHPCDISNVEDLQDAAAGCPSEPPPPLRKPLKIYPPLSDLRRSLPPQFAPPRAQIGRAHV